MKPVKNNKNKKRAEIVLNYFQNGHQDEETSFDTIQQLLKEEVGTSTLRDALNLACALAPRGYNIKVSTAKKNATYRKSDETSEDRSKGEHAPVKKAISELLWRKLLDLSHLPEHACSFYESPTIRNKIGALRRKGLLSILADAGTTTYQSVDALLDVDFLPLQPAKIARGSARFIRPTITTNSLRIANLVAGHRHAKEIELRLVGGTLRQERGSFCGPLAEMAFSRMTSNCDIVIVGTTGYRSAYDGTPSFGADNVFESRIKTAVLDVSAVLKVVVFHSEKLKYPEVESVFTALSQVDLVVCDDGAKTGAREEVLEFLDVCRNAQVATLVLKTALM